jgi:O-Antigen ligase
VSVVQYTITPEQFAAWGPGYSGRIHGTGDVAARGFEDAAGESRNRPFGLGSDFGFGGSVGLLAAPAALALLALAHRHRWFTAATLFAAAGTVLAIVVSQARFAVVGSVLAVIAYAALATTARRLVPTLAALGIVVLIGVAVVSQLGRGATQGSFDRYSDITPTRVVDTTVSYRRASLEDLPRYMQRYPLGAGMGKVGPASEFASGGPSSTLNAEGEANYLVLELGLPGLLVLFGFNVRLLLLSAAGIRRLRDPELRLLLSALAAPLLALFAAWVVGVTSATTPTGPYFWFVAGALAYWLAGRSQAASARSAPTAEQGPVGAARPPPRRQHAPPGHDGAPAR